MLTINVICCGTEKLLNGALNGEKFNLPYSDELYANLKLQQETYNDFTDSSLVDEWSKAVKELLVEKKVDVIETACPDLKKDSRTGFYYMVVDGEVSKTAVPENLIEVILESADKGISPEPIVKAWARFLRNPNFTPDKAEKFAAYITAEIIDFDEVARLEDKEGFSQEAARDRATYNDVAITQEGLIVCKKYARLITEGWVMDREKNIAVRAPLYGKTPVEVDLISGELSGGEDVLPEFAEDLYFEPPLQGQGGDSFFSGDKEGHVIQVGKKHTLEKWNMVNCNDDQHCVKGLHVGGWQYVQAYDGMNCQLLNCFVDPAEIGAICDLSYDSDGAIRVREYFVYGAVEGRTKGLYHSSTYAKMKDAEWAEYKKQAVIDANKILDQIQGKLDKMGK